MLYWTPERGLRDDKGYRETSLMYKAEGQRAVRLLTVFFLASSKRWRVCLDCMDEYHLQLKAKTLVAARKEAFGKWHAQVQSERTRVLRLLSLAAFPVHHEPEKIQRVHYRWNARNACGGKSSQHTTDATAVTCVRCLRLACHACPKCGKNAAPAARGPGFTCGACGTSFYQGGDLTPT